MDDTAEMPLNATQEEDKIGEENTRRAKTHSVLESLFEDSQLPSSPLTDTDMDMDTNMDTDIVVESTGADEGTEWPRGITDQRYYEIRNHFTRYLQELAVDTMYFNMVEHVFLNHIISHGRTLPQRFEPTAEELRAFLIRCNDSNRLFK